MEKTQESRTSYAKLFLTFAKIGVTTFGGGYAMLPMLQREIVTNNGWCTDTDLLDYFAVGQCTPGIIAINTATFIGYKQRGILGGIVATLGMVFPSIVIITIIFSILEAFQENHYVQSALKGIQTAVCALITLSVIKLAKKSIVDILTLVICLVTLACMILFSVSPVVFIIAGAVLGIVFSTLKNRKEGGNDPA